jgi:aminomethyltransferase
MNSAISQDKQSSADGAPNGHSKIRTSSDASAAAAGFQALLSGCAVYDLGSRAKVALSGRDRVRWLNGMITNKIRDLDPGRGVYGFLLNPQGRILGDLYAYNRGDVFLLDIDQTQLQNILAIFARYIIMDDVDVANLEGKLTAIGIGGPKTLEILRIAGIDLPALSPLQLADLSWNRTSVTVVRADKPHPESYEFWLAPEGVLPFREGLTRAGATAVDPAALDLARIAAGIPRYGQDIRERDLPQETEQLRALHFSKGCYVGQEIVERIRSRGNVHRKFTGFRIQGPLPPSGAKIIADGKEVGEVTSSAILPAAGRACSVALGYIRREVEKTSDGLNSGATKLTIADLPFADIFGA